MEIDSLPGGQLRVVGAISTPVPAAPLAAGSRGIVFVSSRARKGTAPNRVSVARAFSIASAAAGDPAAPDHATLLLLCEQVARTSQDEPLLLLCVERRAARRGVSLAEIREGIDLALRRNELQRAERLLEPVLENVRHVEPA